MNFRRHSREEPEINIISMVDVVLVILLFFMVTTTFTKQSILRLDLPAASQTAAVPKAPITVDIDAAGRLALNGQALSAGELRQRLAALARQDSNQVLLLRADRNTIQQHVVTVLDAARQAGLLRVSIATQQAS
ncbi:MAG: ExbD/TolR family protein [Pseudomonadota bacterium]